MPEIPAKAVQAATRAMTAIYAGYESDLWTATDEEAGRAAVEAAAPFIAEHIARLIEASGHDEYGNCLSDGDDVRPEAVRVAREAFTAKNKEEARTGDAHRTT